MEDNSQKNNSLNGIARQPEKISAESNSFINPVAQKIDSVKPPDGQKGPENVRRIMIAFLLVLILLIVAFAVQDDFQQNPPELLEKSSNNDAIFAPTLKPLPDTTIEYSMTSNKFNASLIIQKGNSTSHTHINAITNQTVNKTIFLRMELREALINSLVQDNEYQLENYGCNLNCSDDTVFEKISFSIEGKTKNVTITDRFQAPSNLQDALNFLDEIRGIASSN